MDKRSWITGRVSFVGKSFDSIVKVASRFLQCFKYTYVGCTLVYLYFIPFVCFMSYWTEAYSELNQTSKMDFLEK